MNWCFEHPVLTFILIMFIIFTLDNAITNYFNSKGKNNVDKN